MGRRRLVLALAGLAGVAALGTGCGLPGSGAVRTIDDDEVPYRLLESDSPTATASPSSGSLTRTPVVYWVRDERLVPRAVEGSCDDAPEVRVQLVLSALAEGPTADLRDRGLSSALPTDLEITLAGIESGVAAIDVGPTTPLGADQLPVVVGQVVLSLTASAGVESVVLLQDGEQVQVPLASGALTSEPVTADDYAELAPRRERGAAPGCRP